jgi:hypothetical protein
MLYGISLLAGKFGTAYMPDLAPAYAAALPAGAAFDPILLLGTLFVMIGVAFKLAAFPFHFWCPDVFEGASAEVAGFLSVASKGRHWRCLGARADAQRYRRRPRSRLHELAQGDAHLVPVLALFAGATATFGNLAAYWQTNLKRLLAYSTIAHAGYMMMGLATMNREGTAAVLVYLVAYLFMNLGAFAAVAFLRNLTGSEDLSSFRGLIRRGSLPGHHPVDLPAESPRHPAAGRLPGEVPGLRRPVPLRRGVLHRRADVARRHADRAPGHRRAEHGYKRFRVSEGDEGDDPRSADRGDRGARAGAATRTGRHAGVPGLAGGGLVFVGIYWGPLYQAGQAGVSQFRRRPGARGGRHPQCGGTPVIDADTQNRLRASSAARAGRCCSTSTTPIRGRRWRWLNSRPKCSV